MVTEPPAPPTYCGLAADLFGDSAPGVFEDSTGASALEGFRAYVRDAGATLDEVTNLAPPEVKDDVALVVATYRAVAQSGDLLKLNNRDFRMAERRLDTYNVASCPAPPP